MIMADVLKILFLILGTLIVIVGYWLAAASLFPQTVTRARDAYTQRPFRATMIGVVTAAPLVAVGLSLLSAAPNPLLKIFGVVLLPIPVLLGLLGSAGLGDRIGAGLPSTMDDHHPWRRVLRGGAVLSLTFLLPVVGWLGVLPWTLTSGVGAAVIALRRPAPSA
jgi:hypothetical protein